MKKIDVRAEVENEELSTGEEISEITELLLGPRIEPSFVVLQGVPSLLARSGRKSTTPSEPRFLLFNNITHLFSSQPSQDSTLLSNLAFPSLFLNSLRSIPKVSLSCKRNTTNHENCVCIASSNQREWLCFTFPAIYV
jgi:hypothetical protein